jgi:large subunit ribosomal protein L24
MARRIRRGDRVMVIAGANKGQIGNVISVSNERAKIDGVNIILKHIKRRGEEPGRIDQVPGGIHISNLSHVNQEDKPTRTSFLIRDGVKYLVQRKDKGKEIRKV